MFSDTDVPQRSEYDLMWDMKTHHPVVGFRESAYTAQQGHKFYNAKLWSSIHARQRLAMAKYMTHGFTLSQQSESAIKKHHQYIR